MKKCTPCSITAPVPWGDGSGVPAWPQPQAQGGEPGMGNVPRGCTATALFGDVGGLISSSGQKSSIPPCPQCLRGRLQRPLGLCCTEGPVGSSATHRTQTSLPSRQTNNQATGCGHHRTSARGCFPPSHCAPNVSPSTKPRRPRRAHRTPVPPASRAASARTSASFAAPGRLRC